MVTTRKQIGPADPSTCPACKSVGAEERTYTDTVDFRGLTFDVSNLVESRCRECRHTWHTREQTDRNLARTRETYVAERDRVRKTQGLLTADEIQHIRSQLKLTQRDAALLFGGGFNAFNKYESGEVLQSIPMDRLLRVASRFGDHVVTYLRSVVEGEAPQTASPAITTVTTPKGTILIAGSVGECLATAAPRVLAGSSSTVRRLQVTQH